MATLAILGAAGRMGGALIRCSQRTGDWTLVAAVEQPDHADLGQNAGALAAAAGIDVPITADLAAAAQAADALIDFTFHETAPAHAAAAAAAGKPFVLGTTGLTDAEAAAVRDAARKIPLVWAPNMSLGVNLLFAMVRQAASVLGPDYRVEIDETHHIHKKDAPSGTALQLGRKIAEGKNADFNDLYVHDPDGAGQLRAADKLVIRSHRKGEVVGDHTASFENEGERIEFTHLARSRDAFAMGALHAAAWALGRRPGLYDMQDVLGLQ
jgi:4-hydroxy-tetrahydrodipicolinate reductase